MLPSQSPLKTVVVAGGGIGGLTFAALARRHGMRCIVIERSPDVCRANLGGGIGLWINSLAVLKLIPHALHALEAVGHYMPSPAYRDDQGRVLAQPTSAFSQHFPVLCLERDSLLKALFEACTRADELASPPVQFRTGVSVESYAMAASQDGGGQEAAVVVTLSDGTAVTGDVLVGADGIHSAVRAQLMQDLGLPEVHVEHCGYVYLRANVKVPADEPQWHAHSFEAWGGDSGVRFGYVPLKPPSVFWFAAVPSQGAGEFAPRKGVQAITEQIKAQLAGWISYWASAPIDIPRLVEMTPSGSILKTDIFKVAQTSRFPWSSPDGRVLLLGDAAHATAPNLAQGAGISIEDAADLVFELQRARATWSAGGLAQAAGNYERARKSRAATVQTLADAVALAGQVQYGWLRFLRNGCVVAAAAAVGVSCS
jgi:2-polyprenyl-6-methoxyphenol hydroxylase-like FAD-dependent oxidoreductase